MTAPANWHQDAACRDVDPDLFFPIGTAGPALRQIDEAKRICLACPAQVAPGLGDGPRDHLGLVGEVPPRTSSAPGGPACREEVVAEASRSPLREPAQSLN